MSDKFAFLLADPDGRLAAIGRCDQLDSVNLKSVEGSVVRLVLVFDHVGKVDQAKAKELCSEWRALPDMRHAEVKPWRGCFVELFYPAWWPGSAKDFLSLALDDMFDDLDNGAFIEKE